MKIYGFGPLGKEFDSIVFLCFSVLELKVEEALEPDHQDKEILVTGIVIHQYICPPCPPMAHCERCLDQHVVLSDKFEEVNGYAHAAGRKDWLFLKAFSRMEKGARYIVRVRMEGRRGDPSTSGVILRAKKVKENTTVR